MIAFLFVSVAIGAWDCGCVHAFPSEAQQTVTDTTSHDCHGNADEASKPADQENCCPSCQLEKANNNAPLKLIHISGREMSRNSEASQLLASSQQNTSTTIKIKFSEAVQNVYGSSLPVYADNPIYLLVQSFLI